MKAQCSGLSEAQRVGVERAIETSLVVQLQPFTQMKSIQRKVTRSRPWVRTQAHLGLSVFLALTESYQSTILD